MQVHVRGVCGEFAVAGRDGLGDERVLGNRGVQPRAVVAGEPPSPCEVRADRAQRAREVLVADGGVERFVEAGDEVVVRVGRHFPTLGVGRRERLSEFGEDDRVALGRCDPRGVLLKRAPHFEERPDVVGLEVGDKR